MNKKTKQAITHGLIGFGIGTFMTALVYCEENQKLRKKNKTAFLLHKQMIEDTQADLNDVMMPSGEFKKRIADRLNFITISKSI